MTAPQDRPDERGLLRIGDTERTSALDALGVHLSAGRLDLDEYGERSASVTVARTVRDLQALFTDLPAPHPVPPPHAVPPRGAHPVPWVADPRPTRRLPRPEQTDRSPQEARPAPSGGRGAVLVLVLGTGLALSALVRSPIFIVIAVLVLVVLLVGGAARRSPGGR
jgi:hypothetical protein